MNKIMKMNGTIEIFNGETFDWVSGETEYSLVYDNDGDLYGVEIDGISQEVLDDIVENTYSYDFPSTLEEYKEIEKELN